MRHFTFRPSLTLAGREYRGLRGWAGKPFHPPLTDVPITAYLFAAGFDVLSIAIGSAHQAVSRQLFLAASWTIVGGAAVSLLTALTGWPTGTGRVNRAIRRDEPSTHMRSP